MFPLDGILVIALEQAVAAPACTARLADKGARVIKIERAGGETARNDDRSVLGTSAYFTWLNQGKESAVLDIKDAADRATVERMVARADVFVQNLVPGATARLGLGSAELAERYPRLIAVDIVGCGQDTPARAMRAYDMLIQAESGICAVTGTPADPVKVGVSIADVMTGMNAHAAVLEGLIERQATGRGQAIEIAMFDAMADLMSVLLLHHDYGRRKMPRTGLSHASIQPYGRVACADGELVIVVQNPAEWRRFCEGVLLRPDLADDPRFADNPARVANRETLLAVMEDVFGPQFRAEMIRRLEDSQLACSNVSTVADLSTHPALRRMGARTPGGAVRCVASPLRREVKAGGVPGLGAHTDALRAEFAPAAA